MSALSRQRAAESAGVLPAPPQTYQALAGWRRVFLSPRDAQAYSDGYARWPEPMPAEVALSSPYSTGWFDAEADDIERTEARGDEAWEARHDSVEE
jgi:hypothetical protein